MNNKSSPSWIPSLSTVCRKCLLCYFYTIFSVPSHKVYLYVVTSVCTGFTNHFYPLIHPLRLTDVRICTNSTHCILFFRWWPTPRASSVVLSSFTSTHSPLPSTTVLVSGSPHWGSTSTNLPGPHSHSSRKRLMCVCVWVCGCGCVCVGVGVGGVSVCVGGLA